MIGVKIIVFLALFSLSFNGISQNLIKGKVVDNSDMPLPGARIEEVGTSNMTSTDFDGLFEMTTLNNPSEILIGYIGHDAQTFVIKSDSTLTVRLLEYSYNTRWLTFGMNINSFNSLVGLNFSNGFDEEPLIHFEDFQDNLIFKIEGQTDFDSDYIINSGIGLLYPIKFIGRAELGYAKMNLSKDDYEFQDVHLRLRSKYFRNTAMILKTGFQNFQNEKNFGFDFGLQQDFRKVYLGIMAGYYDYYTLNGYMQYGIYTNTMNLLSLRLEYNRIDNFDFLSVGFHWSFVRT